MPQGDWGGPQAADLSTQALPGPTEASVQSSQVTGLGTPSMKLWMKAEAGETRTLAPTFVQSGSPNDVTPATRRPAAVVTSAGPPESPSQAPLRSVWS